MRIVRTFIFLFLCGALFFCTSKILDLKHSDGIEPLTEFYRQRRNSLDVGFFGPSYAGLGINPAVIWNERGIPSFVLWGSVQPLWNTYYYIKEFLKYQSPKLIVIDIFGVSENYEYSDYSRIVKNNFGLKMSLDKINSIKISTPPEYDKMAMIIEFPAYHTRWKNIIPADFVRISPKYRLNANGWYGQNYLDSQSKPVVVTEDTTTQLPEKQVEYLYKIIDLVKNINKIDLLFIVAPSALNNSRYEYFNTAAKIALENDIDYINFNYMYDDMELDFSTDFSDGVHLNIEGVKKYSKWIANYIHEKYELPDKRNMPGYDDWNTWTNDIVHSEWMVTAPGVGNIWWDK